MDAVTLLREANDAGLTVTVDSGLLVVRGPKTAAPIVEQLRLNKGGLLVYLEAQADLDHLLGEAPSEMVVAAEGYNDSRGNTDPVVRKVNVAMWVLSSLAYQGQAEGELYQSLKDAYHAWSHMALPGECGFCEPLEEA